LGIDWELITKQTVIFAEPGLPEIRDDGSKGPRIPPGDSTTDEVPENMPYVGRGLDLDDVYRQAKALEVAVDLLEQNGGAKILSNSKLATLNNRTAEIHIGDVIPYQVSNLTTGGAVQLQVEKERVGVSVAVTPRAAPDGHITVMVEPNVSNIVGFRGPNNEYPWTKERTAKTQVRVMDGQTFMIAGLLSEDNSDTISKVPLLGDIPVLGYLFRHSITTTKKSDLLIKITPRIIE
ncbi:MAG: type II and III secretion system protein, partial [Candidatus Eisenbacteria bacterium]|nr:type II and III secretion system protein [Candidatus Eisenbacteria bacterium]